MINTVTTTDSTTRRRRARTAIIVGSLLVAVAGLIALLTSGPAEQATTKGVTATLHLPGSPDFALFTQTGYGSRSTDRAPSRTSRPAASCCGSISPPGRSSKRCD